MSTEDKRFFQKYGFVLALLAVILAFVAGRYTSTGGEEKQFTQDILYRNDTKIAVVVQYKERVVHDQGKKASVKVTKPDGTIIEGNMEEWSHFEKDLSLNWDATLEQKTEYKETVKYVEKKDVRPNWRVSVDAGVDVPSLITGKPEWVFGGQVDYRIGGPFYVGVRVNTQGVVGPTFGFEFH